MPRLFMHLDNHLGLQEDLIGNDFVSEEAGIAEAGRTAGAVLYEDVVAGRTPIHIRIMLDREDGSRVATLESMATVARG